MANIIIKELDETKANGRNTNFNVVYVPGCMSTLPADWDDINKAAKKNVPTLCESVDEFETYFGKNPAQLSQGTSSTGKIPDLSYIYAKELLSLGLPVLYESINGTSDTLPSVDSVIDNIYTNDGGILEKLVNKSEHQFKYLTTGGYGNLTENSNSFGLAQKMANVAATRGDCIALIDYDKSVNTDDGISNLFATIKTEFADTIGTDCSAVFTPWVNIHCNTYSTGVGKNATNMVTMPPSYAYLAALAKSIKTNASWLAVAGATRGQIPNLDGDEPLVPEITNSRAESLQNRDSISINAVTNIKPFGRRIWGNRTLKNNVTEGDLTATSFLNIRNMICDVKKVVFEACRKYTFEQNNDVLWINFKAYIEPTLNQMKSAAGLSGYKIIKVESNKKAKLEAVVKLYPLYAVEDFEITVKMLDDEVTVD